MAGYPEETRPSSKKINTLYTYDTEFSADSVEWCPHEPYQNYFVCANYQLAEHEAKRLGRILLFSITPEHGLQLQQTLNAAAVLDQKWCHNQIDGHSILGVVNAERKLEIYRLNKFELQLITVYEVQGGDGELLLLSLDWSTGKISSEEPQIICSDSKGSWHRFTLANEELVLEASSHVHDYEAWIAAFYYWDTNVFFTGGDDSVLLQFDSRLGTKPIIKNKAHGAGVTCIHSNAKKEHIVATGSYDEIVRLWDVRSMKFPIDQVKMPGPLWRLKWDPFSFRYLLAACMLGGAHIISDQLQIVESYYEHKNITYGADWSYLNESEVNKFNFDGDTIIGTCSFYDHLLCVSKLSLL